MKSINELVRPSIMKLSPYQSASPRIDTEAIYLDANENPYSKNECNRYPQAQDVRLVECLASQYKVDDKNLLVTRGADEGIDLLIRTFCEPNIDNIIICPPTYGMYEVCANIQGVDIKRAPLDAITFAIDLEMIEQCIDDNTKIVFLCSPNNPTGNDMSSQQINALLDNIQRRCLLVIDEAYIEFSDAESCTRLIENNPNVIVLRTLSKAYGLAGCRCGSVIACNEIISLLKKVIAPYPMSTPAINTILTTLNNSSDRKKIINAIINERNKLSLELEKLQFVNHVYPSCANFILVMVEDARWVILRCQQQKVFIRDRSQLFGSNNYLRISVGNNDENRILLEVLKNV